MSRPFVFSFVSVNSTRKVLGTREVMRDDLDTKLASVEEWLAAKPESRCATLYGPGMRRRVVTADTPLSEGIPTTVEWFRDNV